MPRLPGPMEKAFNVSVRAAGIDPRDRGLVAAGRRLAYLIDQERGEAREVINVSRLTQRYVDVLNGLCLTTASRQVKTSNSKSAEPEQPKSKIQQMRDELAELRNKKASS